MTTATIETPDDRRRAGPRPARRLTRRGLVPAAAVVLLLLVAGCGDDDTTSAGSGSETGGGGGADEMTIEVVTPADGAEVGTPFDLEVQSSVAIGEPDTGLHHVHLYYDGNTADGEYDLMYDPTFTVERDLGPGDHLIEAVIANADHSLTDARQEITVTIGEGGPGGGGDTDTTDSDGGYDY